MDATEIQHILENAKFVSSEYKAGQDPDSEKYTFQKKNRSPSGSRRVTPEGTEDATATHEELHYTLPDDQSATERFRREQLRATELLRGARDKIHEANELTRKLQQEKESLQEENVLLKSSAQGNTAYQHVQRLLAEQRESLERQKEDAIAAAVSEALKRKEDEISKVRNGREQIERSNEKLHERIQEAAKDLDKERKEIQQLKKSLSDKEKEIEALQEEVTHAKFLLSKEQETKAEILDMYSKLQSETGPMAVEKQVTVEREGMRARTDLLRRVFDTHKSLLKVSRFVRDARNSPTVVKLRNSTSSNYGRDFIPLLEQSTEELTEALSASQYTIRMFFTTTEKLHCGMSCEWLKQETGKPRTLEEKVTTTIITTTGRSSSPGPMQSVASPPYSPPSHHTTGTAAPARASLNQSGQSLLRARSASPTRGGSRSPFDAKSPLSRPSSPPKDRVKSSGYAVVPLKPSPANVPRGEGARALSTNPYPGTTRPNMGSPYL